MEAASSSAASFHNAAFLCGRRKAWEALFYAAASPSTRSGDRCKEMSAGIKGIEKTFTLQVPSSVCATMLCLGGRFELALPSLPLKAVFPETVLKTSNQSLQECDVF